MFTAGKTYTRADIFTLLGLPDPRGGAWYTGYVEHNDHHFIFCGLRTPGRTGHDYDNYFDGPDLIWHARADSRMAHKSIQALTTSANVHVFFRDDDRAPFTYAGIGRALSVKDTVPIEVRWSFREDPGPHPEFMPEEVEPGGTVIEGARRTVTVNVYERDPAARARCIRRWGTCCIVCSFDFAAAYGPMGDGYIHVHHLKPFGEVGTQYALDPEEDLRPVCPNCHAMIHRTKPALSIPDLKARLAKARADEQTG